MNMALAVDSISFDAVRVALNLVANMQRLEMTARFFIQRLEQSGISEQRRQTVSKIDYQALREAAEKATPGNWWIDSHGQAMVSFIDNEVLDVFVTDNKRDAVRHEDTGNLSRWRNDNDATFIAAANPSTVLALLDDLEAAENNLIDSECHVAELEEALRDKQALLEAAEKRIAELQSLTAPKLTQQAPVVPDEMTPKQASRSYCGEVRGYRDGWNACRAAILHGAEPVTDNTNQQFESLSRGDK